MTIEEIQARLEAIRQMSDEPEEAHELEDQLYTDVLVAIQAGAEDPARLAEAALVAKQIPFDRWYA